MSRLIAIDPGKVTGIALFQNSILLDVGIIKQNSTRDYTRTLFQFSDASKPDAAVVEIPRVYPTRASKGDPNDLIHVAILAGIGVAALSPYCEVEYVYPHKWKGNRPKELDNKYTLEKLTQIEKIILSKADIKPGLIHNAIDAIGIGLWKLERR